MPHLFRKHYTRDEARALLPSIRNWLARLEQLQPQCEKLDRRLAALISPGRDLGGHVVNDWTQAHAEFARLRLEFDQREIQVKDLARGLIDFPAVIGGKEVFLCWEKDERDIEFWHDLDAGYAGRERL